MKEETGEGIVITDSEIMDIARPLTNLIPEWRTKLMNRNVKVDFAIQIGARLDKEGQQRFGEYIADHVVLEKQMPRVLHAFALHMPEWAIQVLMRIYKLAEDTRAAIVMLNDQMDEYEVLYQQLEYDFWEGHFSIEDDELEQELRLVENSFRALRGRSENKKSNFNRKYGDSSTTSDQIQSPWAEIPYHTIIGVPDADSQEEIRRQSRRLLKKLHPDRGGSPYLFTWMKQAYDDYKSKG